jgi:hypothetical protein
MSYRFGVRNLLAGHLDGACLLTDTSCLVTNSNCCFTTLLEEGTRDGTMMESENQKEASANVVKMETSSAARRFEPSQDIIIYQRPLHYAEQMQDNDVCHPALFRHLRKKIFERADATGGRSQTHDQKIFINRRTRPSRVA